MKLIEYAPIIFFSIGMGILTLENYILRKRLKKAYETIEHMMIAISKGRK